MTPTTPRLMTLDETANYMGMTPSALRTMVQKGLIPDSCIVQWRDRGKRRFDRQQIDKFINRRRRGVA